MKFTKEEIDLCKEIVKYYRKPIDFADWFFDSELGRTGIHFHTMILNEDISNKIPLWTWQDAREWLKEKGKILIQHREKPKWMKKREKKEQL